MSAQYSTGGEVTTWDAQRLLRALKRLPDVSGEEKLELAWLADGPDWEHWSNNQDMVLSVTDDGDVVTLRRAVEEAHSFVWGQKPLFLDEAIPSRRMILNGVEVASRAYGHD